MDVKHLSRNNLQLRTSMLSRFQKEHASHFKHESMIGFVLAPNSLNDSRAMTIGSNIQLLFMITNWQRWKNQQIGRTI